MNFKTALICLTSLCCSVAAINASAAEAQPSQDEAIVVGACMVDKFMKRTPPISQEKIEKCADAVASAVPKCLGLSEKDYNSTVEQCVYHLKNSQCIAAKINVPLMKFETCKYERDQTACYKALGITPDKVTQLSEQCEKAAG